MKLKWARWILLLFAAMTMATAGCGSCDEESAGRNVSNNGGADAAPGACEDADGDGYFAGDGCDGAQLDCDDSDESAFPGAEEICGDDVDNNCDGQVDEGCQACTDGESRDCGTDEGECSSGVQTCVDGVWGECEGEVRPQPEICDGVDNDCDGEVDEDPEQSLCDDGIKCNGVEVCDQGQCIPGDPVDCSGLDGACYTGTCQEKDGSCARQVIEDGTSCDDGNFCTVGGTCNQGVCESEARDCSGAGDQCNEGVCDAQAEACVPRPLSDGTACDDGIFCTVGDSCQAGTCEGSARDCSAAGDQCNEGVCDEQAGACVPEPVADDTTCDDGLYCTVDDSCQQGQCTGGSPRECSASGGSCRTGTCDEQADSCTGDPVADGTACTNSEFCTVNDTCLAGDCVAGDPRDCSAAGDQCNDGVCDEANRTCVPQPVADGTTCDDGQFCTADDVCNSGTCEGSTRDCSGAGDQCNDGTCDESNDACVPQPISDGTSCDDGQFCTVSDTCTSGTCGGSARSCDSASDQCNDGVCDEDADSCVADPVDDGTSCDDSQFCTVNDVCTAGSCGGASRDCSAAGDQCNDGVCDENNDLCYAEPVADGTSCDDSAWCTVGDACSSGICDGESRDCSAEDDQCNDGACDESNDTCYPEPVADGTVCDDGAWCTVNDTCTSGTCEGGSRDCSSYDAQCSVGTCDDGGDECFAEPVADGTSCDDSDSCTANDECNSGTCSGVSNYPVADAGSDQTVVPNTTVQLDGSASYDPNGQALTHNWSFSSRPSGSSATLSDPTIEDPTFLADIAGTYEVCLEVTNDDGCVSSTDCLTVTVEPTDSLHIELVWFSDDSDVDLHYRAPNGSWWNRNHNKCRQADQGTDTHFCVLNPDWGLNGEGDADGIAINDPVLDVDNLEGYGPENINQEEPFDNSVGNPYRVGVHYFSDKGAGDVNARLRIYLSGALAFEETKTLQCNEFWEVADIEVSNNGANMSITSLNGQSFQDTLGVCP